MRIGEVSKQSGVSVGTIRFYERRKLLKSPLRTASGYRTYAQQDVQVVKAIKEMQGLGFTLKEIKEFLGMHRTPACLPKDHAGGRGDQRMILLTKEKLQNIEKKIELLRQMQKDVSKMLNQLCTAVEQACPVAREMGRPASGRKS